MNVTIAKSAWGWTAFGPNGLMIAHSKNRELLVSYIDDCEGLELDDLL